MYENPIIMGEPVNSGSSQLSANEISAMNDASFGRYNYDAGYRAMYQQPQAQPQPQYVGGFGYNTNPYQNNTYMNPPYGLGSMPQGMYNPYYGNPAFGMYNGIPNPALQGGYQPQYQQYESAPQQKYISPFKFATSEYLPIEGYQEKIEQLQLEFWMKEQEYIATHPQNTYYNNGFNYYGAPYYSSYQSYNPVYIEAQHVVQEMQDAARKARRNLNLTLIKLARRFSGEPYDEKEIEEAYDRREERANITPSSREMAQAMFEQRMAHCVPFDNSQMYRDYYAAVSNEIHQFISPDANLQETFENMGLLAAHYALQEEQQRRRDKSNMYDVSGYKYFVRQKALERELIRKGQSFNPDVVLQSPMFNKQNLLSQFPTLSQNSRLDEDGTLHISCNFGSMKGQTYTVNANEAEYEKKRERFKAFQDTIPLRIYGSKAGGGS